MKKIILGVIFIFCVNCSLFSQTAVKTEEITVFKKENPQTAEKKTETGNIIITSDKMKNPNKKEDEKNNNPDVIITDQKQKNPKIHH